MTYPCFVFSLVVLGTMVASCGGEGSLDPTASGGDDDEPQMNRMIRANPSFAGDIQEIFVRRGGTNADGCHVLGQGSLTLRANVPENHGNLVNVVAREPSRSMYSSSPLTPPTATWSLGWRVANASD